MEENINVVDELKRLTRRVDTLQKSVDLLSQDREILEDLLGRMTSVEEVLRANREHQDLRTKDIKADISDVKDTVEAKVSEVQETVQENLGAIATEVSSKKALILKKDGFFGKMKLWLKGKWSKGKKKEVKQ